MPQNNSRARLAGQLRRTLDAVIPLIEGKTDSAARAELEIESLKDLVSAMKGLAPRRSSRKRTSQYTDDRLSLH